MSDKLVGKCKRCGGTGWIDVYKFTPHGRDKVGEKLCPVCQPDWSGIDPDTVRKAIEEYRKAENHDHPNR